MGSSTKDEDMIDQSTESPSVSKNPYKDSDNGRQRFLLELEFVQCLANPTYIHYLAQNRYFEDEAFIGYLKYLQYWQRPEYIKFIMYPHCLFFLELLQNATFRNAMAHPGNKELAHRQQYFFWKNYRNNRLKHILPRPPPDPEPVAAPASAPAPAPAPATLPPINPASAPALSPMQFAGHPGSSFPKTDMRNSMVDRRKRKYYTKQWLDEDLNRIPPHHDKEVSLGRDKCLKMYYPLLIDRNKVLSEFASFIDKLGDFNDFDYIQNRYLLDPKSWWLIHGSSAPLLQSIALKLLVQPSSSSCAERNWSTYSFIHSLKWNKLTTQRAEDLVFIHSNLRLLSRKSEKYAEGESKLWDIAGDAFNSFEDVGMFDVSNLSLDEPELKIGVVNEDGDDNAGAMEVGSNEE